MAGMEGTYMSVATGPNAVKSPSRAVNAMVSGRSIDLVADFADHRRIVTERRNRTAVARRRRVSDAFDRAEHAQQRDVHAIILPILADRILVCALEVARAPFGAGALPAANREASEQQRLVARELLGVDAESFHPAGQQQRIAEVGCRGLRPACIGDGGVGACPLARVAPFRLEWRYRPP